MITGWLSAPRSRTRSFHLSNCQLLADIPPSPAALGCASPFALPVEKACGHEVSILSKVTQQVRSRGWDRAGPKRSPEKGLDAGPSLAVVLRVRVRDAAGPFVWEDPGLGHGSSSLNLSFLICQMGQCLPGDEAG